MNRKSSLFLLPLGLSAALHWAPVAAEALDSSAQSSNLTPQFVYQVLVGEIALQRGQYGLAARALGEAAKQTRDLSLVRRATEVALFAKEYALGLEAARHWNEVDPQSLRARELLASLLLATGKLTEAQPKLVELIEQAEARRAEMFQQVVRLLANHSDKEEAFWLISALAKPYPDLPEAQLAIAQAGLATGLHRRDQIEASLAAAERAIKARPSGDHVVLVKAQILGKTSPAEAIAYLQAELALQPKQRAWRAVLAQILVEQKRYREGREQLNQLANEDSRNQELRVAAARLSAQLGEHAEAQRLLEQALGEDPRDPDQLRLLLGQLADERSDWSAAIARYRSVLPGEHYFDAQLKLAVSLGRAGKGEEARTVLAALRPTGDAQELQLTQTKAQLMRDAERHHEAFDFLVGALAVKPDSPELLYDTAMAAEKVGELSILEKHLRRLIELKPESAHAYNALGYTLVDQTARVNEGRKYIERALELSPDDPYILDSMGWALYRSGDYEAGVNWLRRAYKERPDAEIAAHLGEVLWAKGEREEAERVWQNQLKATPRNAVLLETMKRLRP